MKYTQFYLMPRRGMLMEADAGAGSGGGEGAGTAVGAGESILSQSPSEGAEAASPEVTGFVGPDGSFVDGWTDKLPEEFGDARKGFSKFRNITDVLKSNRHLESRLGKAATAVLVPGEGATPEEVAAYRTAIGVPDKPEAYKVKPDTLPEGIAWSDEAVAPYLAVAHKHNISETALKELVAIDLQREQGRAGQYEAEAKRQVAEAITSLQAHWGDKFSENIENAKKMAALAGVTDLRSPGFADPNVVKAFAKMKTFISDDTFHETGASFGMSPEAQAKDIQTNPKNPLYQKYQEGDPDAVERVRNLRKKAA